MKRRQAIKNVAKCFSIISLILLLPSINQTLSAQTFDSGSTGIDGAFAPASDITLTLPPNGIYNFTTINIPAGVEVTFTRNAANTPVTFLASGDVTIDGTINLSGKIGETLVDVNRHAIGGEGGPGGFDGGQGAFAGIPGSGGRGPGGGGGAMLLASSGNIVINGSILSNGANPGGDIAGGGGSGGAIRIVAESISGAGIIRAFRTASIGFGGNDGRIRLEAFSVVFSGSIVPTPA